MTHPLAGRKQSPEHVAKRTAVLRSSGAYSQETSKKRVETRRANDGYRGESEKFKALNASRAGVKMPEETRKKISDALKGKKNSLGVKRSDEFKQNLSEFWSNNPNHNHWIDGLGRTRTTERRWDMRTTRYQKFRQSVLERDKYTCVCCGSKEHLHVDHIMPYSQYPELRYEMDNGRVLCHPCHKLTPTYAGKLLSYRPVL